MRFKFAAAWRFLTILPFPWWRGQDEGADLRASIAYFPAIGLAAGIAIGLFGALLACVFPPSVTAALGLALLAAVSGGLHLDGFADSADGLFSPGRSRERALEVMRDSRVGAHGAMGLVFLLLVKYACLASLPPVAMPCALLAAPIAGRAAMLFPMVLLPYARESGLGKIFDTGGATRVIAIAVIWATGAMLPSLGTAILYGLPIWLAVTLLWTRFLRQRLGGATGDTYGAACELGETALLLAVAITVE